MRIFFALAIKQTEGSSSERKKINLKKYVRMQMDLI